MAFSSGAQGGPLRRRSARTQVGGTTRRWRLVIVDDHPIVRQGLAQLLNMEPDIEVCGEAGSGAAAFALLVKKRPDGLLLDLSLDDSNGLDLLMRIRARFSQLPVLVLSMHDEKFFAERVLRAGASGYIMKGADAAEIVRALRRVLAGQIYLSEQMSSRLLHRLLCMPKAQDSIAALSDRELTVFTMIGEGRRPREIAAALRLSGKTVESHRARIKEKLNLHSAGELMQAALHWVRESGGAVGGTRGQSSS